jgi:hypothetical protein
MIAMAEAGGYPAGEEASTDRAITVVTYHDTEFVEVDWVRRLLPGIEVVRVRDRLQTRVIPGSMVMCKSPRELRRDLLARIAQTPGVVLYHVSDEWYRESADHYRCFAHVIRNYYHTALRRGGISCFPLGQCYARERLPGARRTAERKLVWSFAGNLASTRRSMVRTLGGVTPHCVHLTGGVPHPQPPLATEAYLSLMADSVFAPCPMGNANLESFRVYEALDCGAIPIVERRPWLDYFTLLLGTHPLPTVRHWAEAPGLMRRLLSQPERLEERRAEIMGWWERLQCGLSAELGEILNRARTKRGGEASGPRLPGRLRGAFEMLKHHNGAALQARAFLILRRLAAGRGRALPCMS